MVDYLNQYSYFAILYDKANRVYYRIVRLPYEDYDINGNLDDFELRKPNAVIILDEKLNIIGEYQFPAGIYYPLASFVNSDGLHIRVESDDDDFMKFRVFKFTKNI